MSIGKNQIILMYLIIILTVLSFSIIVQSQISKQKYLISSFGLLAFLNILLLFIIPYLYSKFPTPVISSLNSNKSIISAFTFLFLSIHILLSNLYYYQFNLNLIFNSPKAISLFLGFLGFILFIIIIALIYLPLLENKYSILIKNISSYGVVLFAFLHFLTINGFWGDYIIIKIIIIALTVTFFLYKLYAK